MMNTDTLSQYDIMPDQHYNPNEKHPTELALKYVLDDIRTAIQGSTAIPKYLDGEGLISVPLTQEQLAVLHGEIRTLRSIEKMILEVYPGLS